MESITRSALVPYTQQEMFALVSDVDTYPRFLPWCSDAETMSREDDEVCARIDFAVSGVSKSFTTRNRHVGNEAILMQLVEGPFSELQGSWRFEPLGDAGCKISLNLEYDFSSKVVSMVTGPVFSQIASSLVDAFQKRAAEVYGQR
ncbi:MAG: type II toxin-antitoxin system RatA family toxin [Gammaproteobacteria bacterium]|nr:type II toxin-antitoxin system RatA family toxin [Gammaproteobacteria bacterium]